MKQFKSAFFLACACLLAILSGCGGLGAGSTSISGTVTGLTTGTDVVLGDNGEYVTVTANGAFTFSGQVKAGTEYAVTVVTDPVGETCSVLNGSGIIGEYSADVMNIQVACIAQPGVVFGTVSGLAAGATLELNDKFTGYDKSGIDSLKITANGPFAFEAELQDDGTYDVTVAAQPSGQTCTVSAGSGSTPLSGGIPAVIVTCN